MVDVSIIIVNWNVRELLANCLRSIEQYNSLFNYEVIIIDNHSSDNSVQFLRKNFPFVKIIENKENYGFARANNQGIIEAIGRYILLLNPDTFWIDNSLECIIAFMDKNCKVGVLGPKLLNKDRETIQYWGARRLPSALDTFFEYSKLSSLFPRNKLLNRQLIGNWDHKDSREVQCLSGACLFIRRETIQEVGLLDEQYPLYKEDTDWCHRVHLTKWKMYYLSDVQLVHIGSQSSLQNRGPATIKGIQGTYRYYSKFYGLGTILSIWFLILITSIFKIFAWTLIFIFKPNLRETAKTQIEVYWDVCFLIPRIK